MGREVTITTHGQVSAAVAQAADAMNIARHALHLDVPCGTCGAAFSKPCRSSSGIHYMPPKVHRPRKAASDALPC